eukprot:m.186169 g.186169  ORF g.186169 m.186169 type:complete len:134 (+) comp39340_c2_seq14:453-854(+)
MKILFCRMRQAGKWVDPRKAMNKVVVMTTSCLTKKFSQLPLYRLNIFGLLLGQKPYLYSAMLLQLQRENPWETMNYSTARAENENTNGKNKMMILQKEKEELKNQMQEVKEDNLVSEIDSVEHLSLTLYLTLY